MNTTTHASPMPTPPTLATRHTKPDTIVEDLKTMTAAKRYNAWILDQFLPHVQQRIIEIGAGIGTYTEQLADRETVVPVEIHKPCYEHLLQKFASAPNIHPQIIDAASDEFLTLAKYRPDTILCINVLEHLKNDELFLSNAYEMLPPGGKLLLYVPAHKILLGSIDKIVGHYRRYSKFELEMKLDIAGFRLTKLHYMNFPTVLPWFINNRILKSTHQSPTQVITFDKWIVPWLSKIEKVIKPPFGLSLVAIATK